MCAQEPYACSPCQLILWGRAALEDHVWDCVDGPTGWPCFVCGRMFASAGAANCHVDLDHLRNDSASGGDSQGSNGSRSTEGEDKAGSSGQAPGS